MPAAGTGILTMSKSPYCLVHEPNLKKSPGSVPVNFAPLKPGSNMATSSNLPLLSSTNARCSVKLLPGKPDVQDASSPSEPLENVQVNVRVPVPVVLLIV